MFLFDSTNGEVNFKMDQSKLDFNKTFINFEIASSKIKISLNQIFNLIKKVELESETNEINKDDTETGSLNSILDTVSSVSSNSTTSISSNLSSQTNDFTCIEGITKHKDEPDDEYIFMNDEELIKEVEELLNISKKNGIEDYYRKNNIKYRPFNLGGLYSKKLGIKSDRQRYCIRDLCRVCKTFILSDYLKERREKYRKKLDEEETLLNKKVLPKEEYIIDYNKECTYIYERGELKGKKCKEFCIEGKNYCPKCKIKFSNKNL